MSTRVAAFALMVSGLTALLGCSSADRQDPKPASSERQFVRDDVIAAERVSITLLKYGDPKDNDLLSKLEIKLPAQPMPLQPQGSSSGQTGRVFAALGAAGAAALIGAVVDGVQAAIKAEAEKHERQYRQTTYATDFWLPGLQPKYSGFVIERFAHGFGETPASRIVIAFEYSEFDPRLVLLKPVYFDLRAVRAKVSRGAAGMRNASVKVNALIVGTHVDKKATLIQENLADATFSLSAINLDDCPTLRASWDKDKKMWAGELKDYAAGYFFSPRPSQDRLGAVLEMAASAERDEEIRRLMAGGAFGVTAIVTETDDSRAKKTLIEIADFVGAQKGLFTDAAQKAIEGEKK